MAPGFDGHPRGPSRTFLLDMGGEHLHDEQDGIHAALGMRATRESRSTKEYPRGQEVYVLRFGEESA